MTNPTNRKRDKYVTLPVFEESMASIARSFAQVDERFVRLETSVDVRFDRIDAVLETLLKEMQAIRHDAREDRQSIASLAYNQLKLEHL